MSETTTQQWELATSQEYDTATVAPPPRPEHRRTQTFLILFACGLLQLPAWGMAMTFGIFQDAYAQEHIIDGSKSATGVIGTTMNGVMYLSMPILSAMLESSRGRPWRRAVAIAGTLMAFLGLLASSWSLQVVHLVLLQSVVAGLGCAMLYTPTTLWVTEWFRDGRRATAYGVQYSSKNIVGTACPFLMYGLIDHVGVRSTLRIWAGIVLATGLAGLALVPKQAVSPPSASLREHRPQRIPWTFLRHPTIYVYAIANIVFSAGYGLPQTYLPAYASQVLGLGGTQSALLLSTFNAPGILSCVGFGLLSDQARLSASGNTLLSALGSALSVFLLWALRSNAVPGLLIAFSVAYGCFASGYSSTWGGWMDDLEREARDANEAISTGVVYGLLNGARGIGYVVGGVSGVELLKAGSVIDSRRWALGTKYGSVILFTGLSSLVGGWGIVWKGCGRVRRRTARE